MDIDETDVSRIFSACSLRLASDNHLPPSVLFQVVYHYTVKFVGFDRVPKVVHHDFPAVSSLPHVDPVDHWLLQRVPVQPEPCISRRTTWL